MTNPDDLLGCGVSEGYKGAIHLALFALSTVCAAYNLGAGVSRSERRLWAQAAVYGGLAAWEATQVKAHWGSR